MQHLSNLSDSSPNHVNFIFKLTSAFVFGRCCVFSRCITRAQTGACFWRLCLLSSFFLHQRGKKPSHLKQTFWKWRKRESVIPLEKGKLIKAPCSLFSSTELLYFWWMVKRTIAFYKLGTITVAIWHYRQNRINSSIVLSSDNTNYKNDIQLFHQLFDELSVYRDYH